ncbi:MAG: hypothetical protein M3O34_03535, partial [Chloroflexota bacterium]|nr:hypothetical protein [Chloroflexota bacterium]
PVAAAPVPTAAPASAPATPVATAAPTQAAVRPPLTPRWVYEPWVWEDEENTAEALLDLVEGYRERDIPVGAVIIDSPWQTNYNTFDFNQDYPDPAGLVKKLHEWNIRVILWMTGMLNVESIDGPEPGKARMYDEAKAAGYLVDRGATYEWDKGVGAAVDFFNPEAVAWWYRQLDRAWSVGVDGWKVDSPEGNLPDYVQTHAGPKTNRQYGTEYYRAMHRYVAARGPEAIITARPIDGGTEYAPVDANPAGWVGDQLPDWGEKGIDEALNNMLDSAAEGYAVVGSDIGGYRPGERSDNLFTRWTQLGALSPLMENGGRGEHRPWKFGGDVVDVYRYFAKLHHQLVPYLHSAGIEAHLTGMPIIRGGDKERQQYLLGTDLFVAPILQREDERDVRFPSDGRWHDYWDDDRTYQPGATVRYRASSARMPLFIRAGAIIPMQVKDRDTGHGGKGSAGHLTLLLYPEGESIRHYRPTAQDVVELRSRRAPEGVTVNIGARTEKYVLRIKEPTAPNEVSLELDSQRRPLSRRSSWRDFDRSTEGWFYDATRKYTWARFATANQGARLSYRPGG